ncbi:apoptosis regulator BAX-like isoform X2 [Ciconia boyciana]|uniref:apoptosis regulator BAX-like isoform X2 n=1 Tax=Ciconia boyciana TaxID=52775 RepID=UPI003BA2DBC2
MEPCGASCWGEAVGVPLPYSACCDALHPAPPKPPWGAPKECHCTTLPRPTHDRGGPRSLGALWVSGCGMERQEGGGLLETLWGAGTESISCIMRIGGALLRGFVLCLLEQDGGLPRQVPPEELGGEAGEGTAVASLRAATLRVWGHLSRDPEMDSLVGALAGRPPLPALAEVSEQLFRDGINWGRIVVFFYFTYRVVRQGSILSYSPRQLSQDPHAMGSPEK